MTPSPRTFDQYWPDLQRLATAPGRQARWPHVEKLLGMREDEVGDMVAIAASGLAQRIQYMTSSAPTENNVWLISGLLFNQLLAPEGYTREQFYRLLWMILRDEFDGVTGDDVFVLVEAVWALKLTWDSEEPRKTIVTAWLAEQSRTPLDPGENAHQSIAQAILPELFAQLPSGCTHIEGSLTMAAGQVLANLQVTTSQADQPAAFHHLFEIPAVARLRRAGERWWRWHLTVTPAGPQIQVPDQNALPGPEELLRLSDFRAEADLFGLTGTPEWVQSYTLRRRIAYGPEGERPVVGTAEALDLVRSEAAFLGLDAQFRTTDLVAVRLPVGYRVFMYQGPEIPFGDLIIGSPVFYVGDDHLVYRPTAGNPLAANDEFRRSFANRHGYDSTTGAAWPTAVAPVLGPRTTRR